MTKIEATAEVFWTAFKALPKKEQDAVVIRLVQDRKLREDLIDIAIAIERKDEPACPLAIEKIKTKELKNENYKFKI